MLVEAIHVSFKARTRLQRYPSDRISVAGLFLASGICVVDRLHGC